MPDHNKTAYKTTIAEDLESELEKAKERGLCFKPGPRAPQVDTEQYVQQCLDLFPFDPMRNISIARDTIRNAAYDGKPVKRFIEILDKYCAEQGLGMKEDGK